MTYLTRALLNNPQNAETLIIMSMCPSDLGLEQELSQTFEICAKCWNREMPNK